MRKCANRVKRLEDIYKYVKDLAPEIVLDKLEKNSYVVDIGPGPGEFLELGRYFGYKQIGFDAKIEDCEIRRCSSRTA